MFYLNLKRKVICKLMALVKEQGCIWHHKSPFRQRIIYTKELNKPLVYSHFLLSNLKRADQIWLGLNRLVIIFGHERFIENDIPQQW